MKTQEAEWEVLPPEEEKRRASVEPLFKWLAVVMDNFLRLPGTGLRFGLDPIIGLIPGLGDTVSTLISAASLIYAARCGVPKILLARMSGNILVNELIGIIPGVGDAFSFWFKANVRNHELLKEHLGAPRRSRKSDWLLVGGMLALLFLVLCAGLVVSFFVVRAILKAA
jgi:hypothetical protein